MAVSALVGLVGGRLVGSRWILVPLVVVTIIGIELTRRDVGVPTVGPVRLDTPYGILALLLTRGVHGLLMILPMAFGVVVGRSFARAHEWFATDHADGRPVGSWLLGLAVIGLGLVVIWPPATPPIPGPDGLPAVGSLAELTTVRLGDTDQTILIRAANPDAPVLLYLSGGPGQSDLALARAQVSGWEQDLVFVDLDQRGNGKSYSAILPLSAHTLDRAVADVIELTDYLRDRFDEDRIYLMGESWGTILGVLAVQRRPDLYHAWISSGQMVDIVETDQRVYDDLLAYAASSGDTALADKLADIGAPPYRDIPWANANLLAWYDHLYPSYTPSAGYLARGEASGLDPFGVLGSEYSFIEKTNVLRGLIDTFAILYPQLYDLDFRASVPKLEVPVYQLDGTAELDARRSLALEWFAALDAPSKQLVTFDDAAHAVAFEQGDAVQRLFTESIIPATYSP
jgi:pimeloyl-ACP methyl ester carboxylesterase